MIPEDPDYFDAQPDRVEFEAALPGGTVLDAVAIDLEPGVEVTAYDPATGLEVELDDAEHAAVEKQAKEALGWLL